LILEEQEEKVKIESEEREGTSGLLKKEVREKAGRGGKLRGFSGER